MVIVYTTSAIGGIAVILFIALVVVCCGYWCCYGRHKKNNLDYISFILSIIIIIVQLETLVSLLLIFLDTPLVINNEKGMEFEMTEKKELSSDALY